MRNVFDFRKQLKQELRNGVGLLNAISCRFMTKAFSAILAFKRDHLYDWCDPLWLWDKRSSLRGFCEIVLMIGICFFLLLSRISITRVIVSLDEQEAAIKSTISFATPFAKKCAFYT